jgi:SAM-dependent methyltransferase
MNVVEPPRRQSGSEAFFPPTAFLGFGMPERVSFDRVAAMYDETRGLSPRAVARVLAVLVDELGGKRVLEVGVGTGRYAVPLQKSGVRVIGVDISRRMVEFGLAKGMRDVLFADGSRLPFAAGSFDVATTNHVLHLIEDWRAVLTEVGRVTRETYFSVIEQSDRPSINREYTTLVREAGYEFRHPGIHERDLPALSKPDLVIPVGPFHETIPAESLLRELEGRAYSNQWGVPESIHREAMTRLRESWRGKDFVRAFNLEVAFWRIGRLQDLTSTPAQTS